MRTTRYRFEQAVQEVNTDTTTWRRDEFKAILESDKDFTRKADYIGFSIASIDVKVASIDEEIKELQQLKKNLKSAKNIALTIGAEVFAGYGIDKLEGAGISSITVTTGTTKTSQKIEILNEDQLIKAGYYIKVLDEDAVMEAHEYRHRKELIQECYKVTEVDISTPAKLRVNKKRISKQEVLS